MKDIVDQAALALLMLLSTFLESKPDEAERYKELRMFLLEWFNRYMH
jgi:hypothetical protein